MIRKITCKQVQSIMPFYLKGNINPLLCDLIEEHLETCQKCKEYYLNAIEKFDSIDTLYEKPTKQIFESSETFKTKEYEKFKRKLSAYLDSELEDSENIKIKKMTISNPLARKDLEDMYQFKRLLHSSFERTKENFKHDFSRDIIKKIIVENSITTDYLFKIGAILLFMSAVLSIGLFKSV